jgi:hypothetical protein
VTDLVANPNKIGNCCGVADFWCNTGCVSENKRGVALYIYQLRAGFRAVEGPRDAAIGLLRSDRSECRIGDGRPPLRLND